MLNQDYKEMLSLFLEEKVEFFLVGAYAMAAHGFPRATGDIDLFVNLTASNSQKVYNSLAKFGAPVSSISPNDFSKPETIFQIGLPPRRIDIINSIDGVSFQECAEDCIEVEVEGLKLPVISKSKLIQNKKSTGRLKDAADVEALTNMT